MVVASRKPDACEQAAEHLRELGGKAIGVPTHLGEVDDLGALVQRTVDEFGGIDVLVNNAANALAQPLGQMTPEAWDKSYEVNLRGPLFLVQEALPHLKESEHAAMLNMVSTGAFLFAPMLTMYAAGKAALMSYTRSMAAEFAPFGIRVNALAPGPVDTDMMRKNPQEAIDYMVGGTLMRRLATARRNGRRRTAVDVGRGQLHDWTGHHRGRWRNASLASSHLPAGRRQDLAAVLQVQRRLQARRVEIGPQHLLGRLHAEFAVPAECFGDRQRVVDTSRRQPRDDAQPQCLVGVHRPRGQDQVERRARTDDARQGVADADVAAAEPSLMNCVQNRADSDAIRMSQASAMPKPPP